MSVALRLAHRAALVALVSLLTLVGCKPSGSPSPDEGKIIPEGRILRNGLPLKASDSSLPPGDPGVQVIFIKLGDKDAGKEIHASMIDEEMGSFELIGPEGKGIAPGRYRVAVILAPEGGEDELKGKYSRENSKIEVEVKEGEDLIIDLANY